MIDRNGTGKGFRDHLQWEFVSPLSPAQPNGLITVSAPTAQKIRMTLTNGVLRVTGRAPSGANVDANGTLTVRLSGNPSGSALTFTETGVAVAEHALGMTSPFLVNGQPTSVPLKIVDQFAGC
jgi:hypothetical protein